MKKFELDLSEYTVFVGDQEHAYPLRQNISAWLRTTGVFRCANEVAEAVVLSRAIRNHVGNSFTLDETEARILRTAVDRVIEFTADGRCNLGGEIHEEAIIRVAKMKEVE